MPELPEVEHLRRTLVPYLVGATVTRTRLHRSDILDRSALPRRTPVDAALLLGQRIVSLERHGKQLALVAEPGILCVQLGMSGSLSIVEDTTASELPRTHRHAEWSLRSRDGSVFQLFFRDPRRFGGLWSAPTRTSLLERWNALGPDALTIRAKELFAATTVAHRPIKSLLLDQARIAGVGNIYADESLFRAGISPLARANRLSAPRIECLAEAIRTVLAHAIRSGGSTIRDYIDSAGQSGVFQDSLQVYGRAGEPCSRCRTALRSTRLGGRTTVWCRACQRG